MSDDIANGTIDAVWIRDIDRLARDVYIGSGLLKLLEENQGTLFIGSQEIDPANYQEVLLPNVGLAVAQYVRGRIRADTLRGRKASVNKGNRTTNNMYGYDSTYNTDGRRVLRVNQEEAKAVKHIFSLYKKGESFNSIARILNDEGVKTKTAGRMLKDRNTKQLVPSAALWSKELVANMIRRPEYIGYTWNWEKDKLLPATYVPKILDISLEEWQSIYDVVEIRARERNLGINFSQHELSSLIHCSYCGAHYFPPVSG